MLRLLTLTALFFACFQLSSVAAKAQMLRNTPTPPPGCFYQRVECIQAPCDPIMVCPDDTTDASSSSTPDLTCVRAGCSGQLCLSQAAAAELGTTTCQFLPEYACYQQATCEVQPTGECGFTESDEVVACLAEAGIQEPAPLPGDFNQDQIVNLLDYSFFVQKYKSNTFDATIDLNEDQRINLLDYSLFVRYYNS
ncbi:MAG TPA: dockerin type I domain-containing protein [Patescibacteria group bacterium]